MAEDVGEAGVEVSVNLDLRNLDVGTIGGAGEGNNSLGAALDDVLGVAFDEDFADVVGFGELGAGREVGGVEGLGEREVLLGNDSPRDALSELVSTW